ncbi:DUF6307 family protein [Mycobacterium sp.]
MASPTTLRTPYVQRLELVKDTIIQRLHLARHAVTIIPTHDHQAALQLSV